MDIEGIMSWTDSETIAFVFYFIISVFAILGNLAVVIYLLRLGRLSTPYTFIIFHLHVAVLVEGIVTIPYLFTYSHELCYAAEIVHYYCVLMHAASVAMLVQFYCVSIFDAYHNSKEFLKKYGYYILVTFPLIALFRLMDAHYKNIEYPWCIAHSVMEATLYFWTFFFWIWILLLISTVYVVWATLKVYYQTDFQMAWRFFSTIGFYTIIAFLNWIPTSVISSIHDRLSKDREKAQLIEAFPFYFCCLLYAVIFFRDKEKLEDCEEYQKAIEATGPKPIIDASLHRPTIVEFQTADIMDMLENRVSTEMSGLNPMVALEILKNNQKSMK